MSSIRNDARETILIVDDEDEIVQFVQDALEDEGYTVWTAFDGATAVKEARQRNPDLVILDVMLPGYDGFAVCKELREVSIPASCWLRGTAVPLRSIIILPVDVKWLSACH